MPSRNIWESHTSPALWEGTITGAHCVPQDPSLTPELARAAKAPEGRERVWLVGKQVSQARLSQARPSLGPDLCGGGWAQGAALTVCVAQRGICIFKKSAVGGAGSWEPPPGLQPLAPRWAALQPARPCLHSGGSRGLRLQGQFCPVRNMLVQGTEPSTDLHCKQLFMSVESTQLSCTYVCTATVERRFMQRAPRCYLGLCTDTAGS